MGSRRTPSACRSGVSITRREWTAAFTTALGAASATPLVAQITSKTPPEGSPVPAPAAATPEEKLQKAYADIRETSARLAKIEVPMNVEPAFAFRP